MAWATCAIAVEPAVVAELLGGGSAVYGDCGDADVGQGGCEGWPDDGTVVPA